MKERNRETIYKANKQKDALVCDGWEDQASSSQYFSFLFTLFLYICQPPFLFLNVLMPLFFGLSDTRMEDKRLQKCLVK
jgi:hypothetical protein